MIRIFYLIIEHIISIEHHIHQDDINVIFKNGI